MKKLQLEIANTPPFASICDGVRGEGYQQMGCFLNQGWDFFSNSFGLASGKQPWHHGSVSQEFTLEKCNDFCGRLLKSGPPSGGPEGFTKPRKMDRLLCIWQLFMVKLKWCICCFKLVRIKTGDPAMWSLCQTNIALPIL
jgi:hypothetical protein